MACLRKATQKEKKEEKKEKGRRGRTIVGVGESLSCISFKEVSSQKGIGR